MMTKTSPFGATMMRPRKGHRPSSWAISGDAARNIAGAHGVALSAAGSAETDVFNFDQFEVADKEYEDA